MRGGGPDEVLVLLDGFPVNDPLSGRADLRRISTRDVASVSLLRGIQTARYGGRAVSGVILIRSQFRSVPEVTGWAGSFGAFGGRIGAGHGTAALSVSSERMADHYPFTTAGGAEQVRLNSGGSLYRVNARLTSPVDLTLSLTRSSVGCRGRS